MRIIVTGGSGFVGKPLMSTLIQNRHDVVNIDLVPSGVHGVQDIISDLTDTKDHKLDADVCIHLASRVGGFLFNTSPCSDYNHKIDESVLRICEYSNCKLIFFSTCLVFENSDVDADILVAPSSEYAISKWNSEEFLRKHSPCYIFRPTNIFGKSQLGLVKAYGQSHVIPDLWDKIKRSNSSIEVFGDGSQIRNFIHVNDIVNFVTKSLNLQCQSMVKTLASSITISIRELAEVLIKYSNKNLTIKFEPKFMAHERMGKKYRDFRPLEDLTIRSIEEGLSQ